MRSFTESAIVLDTPGTTGNAVCAISNGSSAPRTRKVTGCICCSLYRFVATNRAAQIR